jgi:NAD(P)-dependent dehydrogenase (short-subunit alcohol dehydrogenase family)
MQFQDRTALVTVGDSGIGLAVAKLFLAERANVATTGGKQAALAAAAKELGRDLAAATPGGKTSLDTFEQVLKINLAGVFFPNQVAKPRTKKVVPRRQI